MGERAQKLADLERRVASKVTHRAGLVGGVFGHEIRARGSVVAGYGSTIDAAIRDFLKKNGLKTR